MEVNKLRTAQFKIYTGQDVPEYVDIKVKTLDDSIEEAVSKLCKTYGVEPEDVELYDLI